MTNQNLPPPKSRKGLMIGIVIGVVLLFLIFIVVVIGVVAYWHWTTEINS